MRFFSSSMLIASHTVTVTRGYLWSCDCGGGRETLWLHNIWPMILKVLYDATSTLWSLWSCYSKFFTKNPQSDVSSIHMSLNILLNSALWAQVPPNLCGFSPRSSVPGENVCSTKKNRFYSAPKSFLSEMNGFSLMDWSKLQPVHN